MSWRVPKNVPAIGRDWIAWRWWWGRAFSTTGHSVVRCSLLVTVLFLAGHASYYLLIIGANRILDSHGFGRFYVAWAVLNVFVSPGSIIALFLIGYFAEAFRLGGEGAVRLALGHVLAAWGPWAIAALILGELLLYIGGAMVGVESLLLVVLLPLTGASIVAVEVVRAAFQGMLRFLWSGASWVFSCALRCILGLLGLATLAAPWAGIAGLLIANLLMLPLLVVLLRRMARPADSALPVAPESELSSLREVLKFTSAFAPFVVFSYADVFVAYLTMPATALGAYAASAVLPKAIVTTSLPLAQVMLPVVVNNREQRQRARLAASRTAILALVLAGIGVTVLWGRFRSGPVPILPAADASAYASASPR